MGAATAPSVFCPREGTWYINIHEVTGSLFPSFHLSREDADRDARWNRVACYEHTAFIQNVPPNGLSEDETAQWNAKHKDPAL